MVTVLVAFTLLLAACTRSSAGPPAGSTSSGEVSATRGATLTAGGISVIVPAGAVRSTTTAHLRPAARPLLDDPAVRQPARTLLTAVGPAFELDLSGQQPLTPLTVTVALPALPDQALIVGLTDHAGTITALPGTLDRAPGRYTATVEHLSGFQFAFLNPSTVRNAFSAAARTALGLTGIVGSKPTCAGQRADGGPSGPVVVTGATGPLWPCVSVDGPNVVVTVHSIDGLPWQVRAAAGSYGGAAESDTKAAALQAIYNTLEPDRRYADGLVVGQGQGQWTIPLYALPVKMAGKVSTGAWLASAVVFSGLFLADAFTFGQDHDPKALADSYAKAVGDKGAGFDCLAAAARSVSDGTAPSVPQLVALVQAGLACAAPFAQVVLGAGLGGLATLVLDVVSTGAAVVVGGLEGAVRTATGTDTTAWSVAALGRQVAVAVNVPSIGLPNYRTSGTYPQLTGGAPGSLAAANTALRQVVLDDQQSYRTTYRQRYGTDLDNSPYPGTYQLSFTPELMTVSPTVVSTMYPSLELYPGGNDGSRWLSLTASLPDGRPLALPDLLTPGFGLPALSAALLRQLKATNECARGVYADTSVFGQISRDGIEQGVAPTAANYTHFAFTHTGLDIGIDQGVVGAEACGSVRESLPWATVRPLLSATGERLYAGLS